MGDYDHQVPSPALLKSQVDDDGSSHSADTNYNVDKTEVDSQSVADKLAELSLKTQDAYQTEDKLPSPGLNETQETLHISEPKMRQTISFGMPPAGLHSPSRKYKMASDIFGTGMDKTWTPETPQKMAPPQQKSPVAAPPRHRTEPSSFKITEGSENSAGINDPSSSATDLANALLKKARESTGNPLTGQGYNDGSGNKTAKRYYEGSNANQKLW